MISLSNPENKLFFEISFYFIEPIKFITTKLYLLFFLEYIFVEYVHEHLELTSLHYFSMEVVGFVKLDYIQGDYFRL